MESVIAKSAVVVVLGQSPKIYLIEFLIVRYNVYTDDIRKLLLSLHKVESLIVKRNVRISASCQVITQIIYSRNFDSRK